MAFCWKLPAAAMKRVCSPQGKSSSVPAAASILTSLPIFSRQSGLKRETQIIIRSGCYLTHDSDLFVELHRKLEERHADR